MSRQLRTTDGQASLEWLAVVALVATLLGFGAALAQASYVGRRVTREMARAVCIVGAGDCARDREPCVVDARSGAQSVTLDLFIVRLGEGTSVLFERRSDGTVAVTAAKDWALGVQATAGAGFDVAVAGLQVSAGGGLEASMTGRRGGGRTWIVGSMAAAEALADRLRDAPPADLTYGDGDLVSSLGVAVSADALVHLGGAERTLTFDRHAASRIDHRTGHRTISIRGRGVLGVGADGETYAVELDAAGRPLDLQVVTTGRFAGTRDLPDAVQPVAGLLSSNAAGGRVFEVTAHLDLTDSGNLAAARGLLDAVAHRRAGTAAPAALRERIAARGTVEARVLEERSSSDDAAISGMLGGRLGGSAHVERRTQRLLAAASRGLDGQWLVRDDCA